jgi:8-oxo-dGTP pyrophosphatase MutT (NUDIX family)
MISRASGSRDALPVPSRRERVLRVSFSALLRVRDEGRYVLFHTPQRPGLFSPPGGVFKYFEPAGAELERLGFREQWTGVHREVMRRDLRGFIPQRSMRGFRRWFASGAYREDSAECLRRELIEELGEVGFPELAREVRGLTFAYVGTTLEGPVDVPGKPYRQLRRFEVHDLVATSGGAARLRRRLVDLGEDPQVGTVLCATGEEIVHGRVDRGLIAPQAALLAYSRKIHADVPAMF